MLLMLSVLATGTVANAEEDPSQLINIVGIYNFDSGAANQWTEPLLANGAELTTTKLWETAPFFARNSAISYKLEIEIKKQDGLGELDQASICFFDSNILTTQAERDATCGEGIAAQGTGLDFTGTRTGQSLPQSAVHIGFIPRITSSNFNKTSPIMNIDPGAGTVDNTPNHSVSPTFNSTKSTVDDASEFDGVSEGIAANSLYKLGILFRPGDMAHNTDGWKIRVLAKYLDSSDNSISQHELVSTQSYGIAFTSSSLSITRGAGGQVDFGGAFSGGSVTKTGINTATFRANNKVDITLNPDSFSSNGTTVEFGTAANEISLSCGPDQNNLLPLAAGTPAKIFAGLDGNSAQSVNGRLDRVAPTHDCTLSIGADVPAGEYSNTMTVGFGKATNE